MSTEFTFLDPGPLVDDDLELILAETMQEDKTKGWVPAYKFEMRNTNTHETMGTIHLRIGHTEGLTYSGNIGYSVDEQFRGHRYATRSCRLLFPLARKHNLNTFWITCAPDNTASRKTIEAVGGVLEEITDIPEWHDLYKTGRRKSCRYRIDL